MSLGIDMVHWFMDDHFPRSVVAAEECSPGTTDAKLPTRFRWLPRWVAFVNSGGTPSAALLLVSLASIILILSGGYEWLIAVASLLVVVLYLSGSCALFALRVHEPDLPRPFKAWGYPWVNLGVLLASAAFLVAMIVGDLKDALFTLVLISLSYPVYFFVAKSKLLRASTSDAIAVPPE